MEGQCRSRGQRNGRNGGMECNVNQVYVMETVPIISLLSFPTIIHRSTEYTEYNISKSQEAGDLLDMGILGT